MNIKQIVGDISSVSTEYTKMGNPGELYKDVDGKTYKLCLAGASIASVGSPTILQLDSVSGSTGYTVEPCAASTTPVYGFNKTGASVAAGSYFYAQVGGICSLESANCGAAIAANQPVVVNGSRLVIAIPTVTSDHVGQAFGQAMVAIDSTSGGYIYLDCMGNQ